MHSHPNTSSSSSSFVIDPLPTTTSSSSSRLHVPTRSNSSTKYTTPRTLRRSRPSHESEQEISLPSSSTSTLVPITKRARSSTILNQQQPQPHFPTPALTPEEYVEISSSSSSKPSTEEESQSQSQSQQPLLQLQQPVVQVVQQVEKDKFVNGLVGASVLAIESIWGPSSTTTTSSTSTTQFSTSSSVLPLDYFVREVLRRSRTSCSTLQLSLYYLHKLRKPIRDQLELAEKSKNKIWKLAAATSTTSGIEESFEKKDISSSEGEKSSIEKIYFENQVGGGDGGVNAYPSPPESPDTPLNLPSTSPVPTTSIDKEEEEESEEPLTERLTRLLEVQKSPLLCGRRMFLSSLISASKYLQDRNYSNKAWSKISGLGIQEINRNEKSFLELIEWDLHLKAQDFKRWTDRLNTLTTTTSRQGLVRSCSEYLPTPPLLPTPTPTPTSTTSSSSSTSSIHPTTSNLVRSKLALTRGSSEPQLEFTKSIPTSSNCSSSSRSFPIAQPLSSSRPTQAVEEIKEIEMKPTEEEAGKEEVEKVFVIPQVPHLERKVRKLPIRRSHPHNTNTNNNNRVPLNWSAGSSLRVVGRGEMISVH
ncbi:hypothetical protein JCM3765_006477 [Sporobolomyces pararoseus]